MRNRTTEVSVVIGEVSILEARKESVFIEGRYVEMIKALEALEEDEKIVCWVGEKSSLVNRYNNINEVFDSHIIELKEHLLIGLAVALNEDFEDDKTIVFVLLITKNNSDFMLIIRKRTNG